MQIAPETPLKRKTAPVVSPPDQPDFVRELAPHLLNPGVPPWIATVAACLCSFMVIADGAIVSLALPAMRHDLGLSLVSQQWVVDAEKLTLGGFMLLTARAGDIFGRRKVLLIGLMLFMSGGLTSALATTPAILITARAIQGIGASALATSTLAVIFSAYRLTVDRERAVGIWTAAGAVAATVGFLGGGALIVAMNWRWAMALTMPVGAVLGLIVVICFSAKQDDRPTGRLDLPGAASITVAMACLLYAITHLASLGWRAPSVLLATGVAIFASLLFVLIEARSTQPLVRLDIFSNDTVRLGLFLVACLGALLSASMFFIPITLQQVSGYTPLQSGGAMLPLALLLGMAPLCASLLRGVSDRIPAVLGFVLAGCGLLWLGRMPTAPAYGADILPATVLIGSGIGFAMVSITRILMVSIASPDSGLASGLHNSARQLGGAIGIAGLVALAHVTSPSARMVHAAPTDKLLGFHAAFLAAGIVSLLLAGVAMRFSSEESICPRKAR